MRSDIGFSPKNEDNYSHQPSLSFSVSASLSICLFFSLSLSFSRCLSLCPCVSLSLYSSTCINCFFFTSTVRVCYVPTLRVLHVYVDLVIIGDWQECRAI